MNKFKDKFAMNDELITENGQLILPSYKETRKIIGVIDIYNGVTGKKMFRFYNDVIILGATYVLEKMFNIRSSFGMPNLSTDLDINASITPNTTNLASEFIFGFVVGTGGAESSDLVKAVKFKDKSISSIIPMRVVDTTNDLTSSEQANYALKKTVGSKYYYYAKRFDTSSTISHLFTDGTEIPSNINETDTSLGLLVFSTSVLSIGAKDLREYFLEQYGSIDNCRFNTIGLVAGFLSGSDFANVRTITKINIPNMFLRDDESSYKFTYKLYAI